ncbi:MAG TPA: hypothetical protein VF210_02540 [Pseudomonadales bacterium]
MSLRRGTLFVGLALLLCACGADGPGPADTSGLDRLGLAEADAERYALDALATGQPYGWMATAGRPFKALADDDRVAVVESLARWARRYAESDLFRSAYAEHRRVSEPQPPSYATSVEQEVERQIEEGLAQIEQTRREVIPMLPENERASLLESLEAMAAQYRDPKLIDLQRQGIEMQRAADAGAFEQARRRWSEELPEDPNELIKRRLRAFVDACGEVDFDAELVERYGLMRFADPRYESKSSEWKTCFRAGEPTVRAALEAAEDWLDDLG